MCLPLFSWGTYRYYGYGVSVDLESGKASRLIMACDRGGNLGKWLLHPWVLENYVGSEVTWRLRQVASTTPTGRNRLI